MSRSREVCVSPVRFRVERLSDASKESVPAAIESRRRLPAPHVIVDIVSSELACQAVTCAAGSGRRGQVRVFETMAAVTLVLVRHAMQTVADRIVGVVGMRAPVEIVERVVRGVVVPMQRAASTFGRVADECRQHDAMNAHDVVLRPIIDKRHYPVLTGCSTSAQGRAGAPGPRTPSVRTVEPKTADEPAVAHLVTPLESDDGQPPFDHSCIVPVVDNFRRDAP